MSTTIDRDRNQSDFYLYYHDDGLIDLFIGSILLLAVLFLKGEMIYLLGIFPVTFWLIWRDAKKKITAPRMKAQGIDPLLHKRAHQSLTLLVLAGLIMLLAVVLLFMLVSRDGVPTWLDALLSDYFMLIVAVFLAVGWAAIGLMNNVPRFHGYAALTLLALTMAHILNIAMWWPLTFVGVVVLVVGTGLLVRFITDTPVDSLNGA